MPGGSRLRQPERLPTGDSSDFRSTTFLGPWARRGHLPRPRAILCTGINRGDAFALEGCVAHSGVRKERSSRVGRSPLVLSSGRTRRST